MLIAQPTPEAQSLLSYLQIHINVYVAHSNRETASIFSRKNIDVVLIAEDRDPQFIFRSLDWVYTRNITTAPVVVYTAQDNPETIIAIMKKGIDDYLLKTINLEQLQASLVLCMQKRPSLHRRHSEDTDTEEEEIGKLHGISEETKRTRALIRKFATTDATVMLYGESGTGKTLVARLIHEYSNRRNNNFCSINCAAIPETLMESELFGSEVGAFTGAVKRRGVFARAHRGTLFLDELGDFSLVSQSKILQAIEEKRYSPLGSEREFAVDIRFISATNKNITEMIEKREFRLDLYYRMAILSHTITPLRERPEDIIPIAWHTLRSNNDNKFFSTSAIDKLTCHSWPGNIRELKNCIIRASIMSDGNRISAPDILF